MVARDSDPFGCLNPDPVITDVGVGNPKAMEHTWRRDKGVVGRTRNRIGVGTYIDLCATALYVHDLIAQVVVFVDRSSRLAVAIPEVSDPRKVGNGILDEIVAHPFTVPQRD